MSIRIARLQGENFMRMKAFDITPDPDFQVIEGENGAGKSSVLKMIPWLISGAEGSKDIPKPVRTGADKAWGKATFTDGMVIEKTQPVDGKAKLVVRSNKEGSPQALLTKMQGRFWFDAFGFMKLSPKEQIEALVELSGNGDLLRELDEERQTAYDKRRDVNRDLKQAEAALKELGGVDLALADQEAPNTAELSKALQEALAAEKSKQDLVNYATTAKQMQAEAEARIEKLEADIAEQKQAARLAVERHQKAEHEASEITVPDIEAVRTKMATADETRARILKAQEARKAVQRREALVTESETLTKRIEKAEGLKRKTLETSKLPIPGLAYDEEGVTYNGEPLVQISDGEARAIGVALSMASNPELRVLLVRDATYWTDKTLAMVQQMAKNERYQVLIERPGKHGVGILIEDGEVVEQEEPVVA